MASRRKITIYLYDGDDLAELQRLGRVAREARAADEALDASLADTAAEDATTAYNAYLMEAKERADKVILQALPRSQWRSLVQEHPAREVERTETVKGEDGAEDTTKVVKVTHPDDEQWGVNDDTFGPALLAASVVEPTNLDIDDLSEPDFDRLYTDAYMLNRVPADPKELPAYVPTLESDET